MAPDRTSARTVRGRRYRAGVHRVVRSIDAMRLDAGLSIRALASAAEVDPGFLSQIIAGKRLPSGAVLFALADAVGGDLSMRVHPAGGPRIRDRIQAPIVEALLRSAAPAWRGTAEVAVSRPARGFIDLVFDRRGEPVIVATEVQSRLDRLEQQIRWFADKAASLPSSDLWPLVAEDAPTSRLLVIRSTVATRDLARRFELTLASAYPARAFDAYHALHDADRPWPGPAILWADVRGDAVRILERPPRGVALGR